MAKNTSQGASSRQGAPKSPAPAPSLFPASEDEVTMLEEALSDVRHTVGVLRREMASMQRVLDVRGHEATSGAKKNFKNQRVRESEGV